LQHCRFIVAADALARGAKALEDKAPAEASALYGEAIEQYESDGKEAQATDVFRQAIALLVKRQVCAMSSQHKQSWQLQQQQQSGSKAWQVLLACISNVFRQATALVLKRQASCGRSCSDKC
jgi:hypothetical protein